MVSAINSALSGLNAASNLLQKSANNLASTGANNSDALQPVTKGNDNNTSPQNPNISPTPADLDSDMVNSQIASYDYQANLKTLQVSNQTQQSLLNIIS